MKAASGTNGGRALVTLARALQRLPAAARAFALTRCAFALVGAGSASGLALPPGVLGDGRWILPLDASAPDLGELALHETAHAFRDDRKPGADVERGVADLLATWGVEGRHADGDVLADAYESAERRAARFRARIVRDRLMVECSRCGSDCEVVPLVVAGLGVDIGIECATCVDGDLLALEPFARCPTCGGRVLTRWASDATDTEPRVLLDCVACGAVTRATLVTTAPTRRPTPAESALRDVWRALVGVEESLRGRDGGDGDAVRLASARGGLSLALKRVRAARELLGDDPRARLLDAPVGVRDGRDRERHHAQGRPRAACARLRLVARSRAPRRPRELQAPEPRRVGDGASPRARGRGSDALARVPQRRTSCAQSRPRDGVLHGVGPNRQGRARLVGAR